MHAHELERVHNPHPLDFRYLEDSIEEVEANGQIVALTADTEIVPDITMIHTPTHTQGGMSIRVEIPHGSALICGFRTILENLYPPAPVRAMEMEVIPPGTHVHVEEAYATLVRAKTLADHILPLHEPRFAALSEVPA